MCSELREACSCWLMIDKRVGEGVPREDFKRLCRKVTDREERMKREEGGCSGSKSCHHQENYNPSAHISPDS
jgi:hypothetical protein